MLRFIGRGKEFGKESKKMYTQEEIDYVHDTLTDLLISCMRSYRIPIEEPKIGDWCIEISSFRVDHDNCIGKLIKAEPEKGTYVIETVGGKIVTWRNASFAKIPDKYLRSKSLSNGSEP